MQRRGKDSLGLIKVASYTPVGAKYGHCSCSWSHFAVESGGKAPGNVETEAFSR